MDKVEARYHSRVDRSGGPEACWPWVGKQRQQAYGRFAAKLEGKRFQLAHHFALYYAGQGLRPEGKEACHSCQNALCQNPAHLRWDTHQANVADREREGTTARGQRHGRAKLTEAQVIEMRRLYDGKKHTCPSLGARFGVTKVTAWRIVNRHSWTHI